MPAMITLVEEAGEPWTGEGLADSGRSAHSEECSAGHVVAAWHAVGPAGCIGDQAGPGNETVGRVSVPLGVQVVFERGPEDAEAVDRAQLAWSSLEKCGVELPSAAHEGEGVGQVGQESSAGEEGAGCARRTAVACEGGGWETGLLGDEAAFHEVVALHVEVVRVGAVHEEAVHKGAEVEVGLHEETFHKAAAFHEVVALHVEVLRVEVARA